MKFCYVDESGTDNKPYAVMAGIIVDATRTHITKNEWAELLRILSNVLPKPINEIHTSDFYSGHGIWHSIKGDVRAKIIDLIFKWLSERKHEIVYSVIDQSNYNSNFKKEPYAEDIPSLWLLMALHICLATQKHYQKYQKNKGNTVFIFDDQKFDNNRLINLIKDPPNWTDTYYRRDKKQAQFSQIIDVPYFGNSHHVGLIQIADFVSFFIRRFTEIQMGVQTVYDEEPEQINKWASSIFDLSIPKSNIYLSIGRCECADLFYRYAPAYLR